MDIQIIQKEYWPVQLTHIPDPPQQLYIRGTIPDPDQYYICIVGTRKASTYGKDICRELITGLQGYPVTIVSGLALGIDTCAHRTALDCGLTTIAFPGSGLNSDILYPRNNHKLAEEIVYAGGCLLSEHAPNTISAPWIFPKRNRLMAGLCSITIVIEASLDSGSLITATYAQKYKKIVGAVPGSIHSFFSIGPHALLRQGAIVIESSEDIVRALGLNTVQTQISFETPEEKNILEILTTPRTKDELSVSTVLPIQTLQILLSRMEIKDMIEEKHGRWHIKVCKKNPL